MKLKTTGKILASTMLLLAAGAANALTLTTTESATIATQTTNWGPNVKENPAPFALSVAQFDASLGKLLSVRLDFSGNVDGQTSVESLDAAAATIITAIRADIALDLTALTTNDFLLVGVGDSHTQAVSADDGTLDFSGTSGFGPINLSGTATDFKLTTNINDLAFFTGIGAVSFDSTASGISSASGAGNIISQFATNAGSDLQVTYTYSTGPTLPEPASLLLIGVGLLGFSVSRRNHKTVS